MKKRYLFLILLAFIVICTYAFFLKPMLNIYTGFSAKTMCSCHFIQDRTLDDILNHELTPADFMSTTFDVSQKSATTTFLGTSRTAVFRPNLGCTLLSERSHDDVERLAIVTNKIETKNSLVADVNINPALQSIVNKAFDEDDGKVVNTRAILIYKDSLIVGEKYAPGYTSETPQMGWSMTKSITNALVGILVKQGQLDIYKPALIKEWHQEDNDPRNEITIDHLLRMSSGLHFVEEYDKQSTVNQMLWTKADAGKVAYSQNLRHPVDTKWYYSSGTTNIISHIIRQQFSTHQEYINFPYNALFNKLGMNTAIMETDANGTYVGSSLMYASARDWAKLGILYLQDGVWDGERILPEGWVDYSKTPTQTVEPYNFYGAHFWINASKEPAVKIDIPRSWPGVPDDAYYASGFEGQTVLIIPSHKVVIVRLGQTLDRSAWDIGAFAAQVLEVL